MKKRIKTNWVGLTLAGMTLLGTACSNGANSENNAPANNETANNAASKKPFDISITLNGGPKTPDSWSEKTLEEQVTDKLGRQVTIDPIFLPASEVDTKINLLMSAKNTRPNILWTGDTKEYSKWVQAGIVQDLTPSLQKYGKEIIDYYSKDTLFYHWDSSGKLYQIPGDVAEAGTMTTIIRKDWLDKLGLQMPKTLDEFVQALRAFTNDDPDGNGKKDTYGLSGDYYFRSLAPFFYAYGVDPDAFIKQDDGSIKYGATMPQVKTALQQIAKLYGEGVIDPRMASAANNTNEKVDEIYASGKVGAFYRWVAYFNPSSNATMNFKQNNPGGEYIAIDPVAGPDGFKSDIPSAPRGWCYLVVTDAGPADEAVQVLNVIASPEVNSLLRFGKEGEHYTMDNGVYNRKVTPDEANKLGLDNFSWVITRKDASNLSNTPEVTKLFEYKIKTSQPMRDKIAIFKATNRPQWDKYSTDIQKARDEAFWGIITGKLGIDAFDKFVAQYEKLGGKEVDEEANTLYSAQEEEYAKYDKWYEENITPYK
ncbi:ABC transporter substrate-binding protein [Paenibacillus solisilvae]|uniref:ABC transporter substrate-binding protein n=1 Tax=Paenibacillus solisilvae TaxID=2486751 RepID=A0ABW0W8E9_9BACL